MIYNLAMLGDPAPEITQLLLAWGGGDRDALDRLTPLVVDELRRIARRHIGREHGERTIQATALVNEAYLRLVEAHSVSWHDRAHFFAVCARIMRRILIESARERLAAKRGGGALRVTFDEALPVVAHDADFLVLEEALTSLASFDERKAKVVELRFFGGLSVEETAHVLGISEQSVHRDWRLARSWLLRELGRPRPDA